MRVRSVLLMASIFASAAGQVAQAAESYSATVGGKRAPKSQPILKGVKPNRPVAAADAKDTQPQGKPEEEMSLEELQQPEIKKGEERASEINRIEQEIKAKEAKIADLNRRIDAVVRGQVTELEKGRQAKSEKPTKSPPRKPASTN